MLDKVVLFDMLNSTYTSRACRLSKVPVTLELLNSRRRAGGKYYYRYNMFYLSSNYFINPSKNEAHLKIITKAVTKPNRKKILKRLQAEFGIFPHSKSFASVDTSSKVISNLAPLIQKYQKTDHDRHLLKQFLRLHCWNQLKPNQICQQLNISRLRYNRLRQSLYQGSSNPLNSFKISNQDPLRLLVAFAPKLILYMKRTSFRLKSLTSQHRYLLSKNPQLAILSPSMYKRFVIQYFGFKYRPFSRTYANPDKTQIKSVRVAISYALAHFANQDCLLLYFDSTSYSDNSFKKFIWSLGKRNQTAVNDRKVYGVTSVLMATTNRRIINYWIVTKVNALTTASFLDETIHYCRNTLKHKSIVVFMDNARIHLTLLMKTLAYNLRVYFFLNAPLSSKINQIEYVFELAKRNFRQMRDKVKKKSLAKNIRDQLIPLQDLDLHHQTKRFRKFLLTSILKFNMWNRSN